MHTKLMSSPYVATTRPRNIWDHAWNYGRDTIDKVNVYNRMSNVTFYYYINYNINLYS